MVSILRSNPPAQVSCETSTRYGRVSTSPHGQTFLRSKEQALNSDRVEGVEGVKDLVGGSILTTSSVLSCPKISLQISTTSSDSADGLALGSTTQDDWPILSVEFSSLKDRKPNVVYEVRCSYYGHRYSPITDFCGGH